MLPIYIPSLLGIVGYRFTAYWKWVVILFAWMVCGPLLFAAGGTLADPTGDGLITHRVRVASDDGPAVALVGIIFLLTYYGGVVYFIRRMYLAVRSSEESMEQARSTPMTRKALEIVALTAAFGGLAYWQYGSLTSQRAPVLSAPVRFEPEVNSAAPDPVATQLTTVAAQLNDQLPQAIDEITTLVRASADGRVFTYHYELSRRDGSDEELRAFISQTTVPKVCANPEMRVDIKDYGITYRYSYVLPNNDAPVSIDVDWEACAARG